MKRRIGPFQSNAYGRFQNTKTCFFKDVLFVSSVLPTHGDSHLIKNIMRFQNNFPKGEGFDTLKQRDPKNNYQFSLHYSKKKKQCPPTPANTTNPFYPCSLHVLLQDLSRLSLYRGDSWWRHGGMRVLFLKPMAPGASWVGSGDWVWLWDWLPGLGFREPQAWVQWGRICCVCSTHLDCCFPSAGAAHSHSFWELNQQSPENRKCSWLLSYLSSVSMFSVNKALLLPLLMVLHLMTGFCYGWLVWHSV